MNEPYERKLVKGVTTTLGRGLVTVTECIKYIESCGWKLTRQARGLYIFENPNSKILPEATFSLRELRDTYHNGW
jgi:hypothetical protein